MSVNNSYDLYVDGSFGPHTNNLGWGFVCNSLKEDMMPVFAKYSPEFNYLQVNTPTGTRWTVGAYYEGLKTQHNGAELHALLVALRATQYFKIDTIYSDSQVCISWCSGKCGKDISANKKAYILELSKHYNNFIKQGGKVLKISGDKNPADPGWH
jgi:ribonuclease HI